MKIIQSFAQFQEGSPYLGKRKNQDYVYLNFYSFMLSYLSIKEQYGPISMYCNHKAYESFIKYIPYDEIITMENNNPFLVWSKYKTDVMRLINDDLIHIDSDVLLFNNLFDNFIYGDYDIMVQDILPFKRNLIKQFGFDNKEFLADTKILTKPYDGRCMSCGVVGLKKNMQKYYFAGIDVLYASMLKHGLEGVDMPSMLLEEQLLYYIAVENDFKYYEVLSSDLVDKDGVVVGGDKIGYLHLWQKLKFKRDILDQIRKKIYFEYSTHYNIILQYEHDVMSKFKFFKYFNFPLLYSSP